MSLARFVLNSIIHHRRIHLAVALGVATATMVLTGALLVGDSVRGSLRALALERLGRIDEVLVTDRFFREALAGQIAGQPGFAEEYVAAEPAILLAGSLTNPSTGNLAGRVTVVGSRAGFWELGSGGPSAPPQADQIVLNTRLAQQLNVQVGEAVNLQIGQVSDIPADSPLGRKTDTIRRKQLIVREIIPTEGLGRFGLQPSQQLPANAFVALETVQQMLDKSGRVNTIFVARGSALATAAESSQRLASWLHPQLTDYGLQLDEVHLKHGTQTVSRYFNLTSDRMLLAPQVVTAARRAWQGRPVQDVLTYLANWITAGDERIPYSTIAAVDSVAELGPLLDDDGRPITLEANQIAINDWTTRNDHLSVRAGDDLSITFFEPDTTHGQVRQSSVRFQLAAVVPLGGDGEPITPANDRALTPEVPGVTDQASIDGWNPPFPFDASRIRDDRDEAYWRGYRATPKAFVSLRAGRELWGSRFGDTTSVRVAADAKTTRDELAAQLLAEITPAQLGFEFQPVKRQALQASSGTTPFDVLFLMFSMFLIAAALMLVALLFRLGIEQRAEEVGVLLAVGFTRSTVTWLLAAEALLVAGLGAVLGMAAGLGYAALMLAGLRTWWVQAVSTPFLRLHPTTGSLVMGLLGGLIVGGLTILWSLRAARRLPPRTLLAGQFEDASFKPRAGWRWSRWIAAAAMVLACSLVPVAMQQGGEVQAGIFFAAGALVLLAGLLWIGDRLHSAGQYSAGRSSTRAGHYGTLWLAKSNAARNPTRSTLTIGLVAAASFLIIAVSAFRLDETDAGGGGYNLMAQSASPLYYDLASEDGQFELGIDRSTAELLNQTETAAFRVRAGQDASCLNLYRSRQPRILGVPPDISSDFLWAARSEDVDNPWGLLRSPLRPADNALQDSGMKSVPVILDQNTAMYSLHLWKGVGESLTVNDEQGRPVRLQIVALLKNSIFQGDVLMSDESFLELFPSTGGHHFFLMRAPAANADRLQTALEDRLADFGFDAMTTRRRLADLFAVQNTYLSTFQSLGGLGLLLGTLGLATVQLRNVIARRGELALMRAAGFRRRRLAALVMIENNLLLISGLGVGVIASLVAIMPHLLAGGARFAWLSLIGTLVLVVAVGFVAGLAAVCAALRAPVIAALRGE